MHPGPGYVFETTFVLETGPDGQVELVARDLGGRPAPRPIVTGDRRALPGQRVRARLLAEEPGRLRAEFLGLVEPELDGVWLEPTLREQLLVLLASGRSVLLDGPQGTGKTTIARALGQAMGFRVVFFNASVCIEPQDFVGSLQLSVDEAGRSRTVFVPTDVLRAVRDAAKCPGERFLVFLDELNRCRPQALNLVMSAIDATRRLFDPEANAWVPIPDNVQWIAAINNGRQFTGTYRIDVAQLDRFAVQKVDYPPEAEEVRLLRRRYPLVREALVRTVVRVAGAVRRDPTVLTDLSMRATDEACLLLSYPTHLRRAAADVLPPVLRAAFCNRLPGGVDEHGSEAHAAWLHVQRGATLGDLAAPGGAA